MLLFIELLEFADNSIERETVKEFICASLLRNITNENVKSGDVINDMFGEESSVTKSRFVELMDLKENSEFKSLMNVFMQLQNGK